MAKNPLAKSVSEITVMFSQTVIERTMPPIDPPVLVGDKLHFDWEGRTWIVPLTLCLHMVNSRKVIDLIKREGLVGIVRGKSEQERL